ncbi:hypothetical protein ACCC98_06735 [Rhizobium pisi]|uniref:hypothetical protein n=1 Tax=Rhizobium pisi TaxID=574561 RepID=UPI0039AFF987
MKLRTTKFMAAAIAILASYSPAIAAGAPPTLASPSDSGTLPTIEWNMPGLKDEATPKTLVLCSQDVDEQIELYKSLIEKIGTLKGYTILDGNEPISPTKATENSGYIVFINKSANNKELMDCISNYPELKSIFTDFVQNKIPSQQSIVQELIRTGALPPGMPPSQCYSRFYYPAEEHGRWIAYVGIDYSADNSCFEDFLPNTFGISPRSCQSVGICSGGEMKGK